MSTLDRDQSARESISSTGSSTRSWTSITSSNNSTPKVLAIECIRELSVLDEWSNDFLQSGDIVEEIQIGNMMLWAPFKDGNSGVQKQLHICFKNKATSIRVRVRRCEFNDSVEISACIFPDVRKKHRYVLRGVNNNNDPNFDVAFSDRTESQCLQLKASRTSRLHQALSSTRLQDGHVAYPWERKTQETPQVPKSSCFLSILFYPKASEEGSGRYKDMEDTLARANAWLNSAQLSGVPIALNSIQTESLLTKISGETASSTVNTSSLSDLPNLANASLYGFEDYHGVDLGVVRVVRLWYSPIEEYPLEIDIREGDLKLGFVISRTEEGFIFISSVQEGETNVPSERSGLNSLFREAISNSKLLIISRINNEKVLPWIVSSAGDIQCFDTVSISQKLSLHRHAQVSVLIHFMMWDQTPRQRTDRTPLLPEIQNTAHHNGDHHDEFPSLRVESGDDVGEVSFRF